MSIDDAEHLSPEQKQEITAGYLPHEREARARGIPVLGSGRIFPVPEEDIACDPFEVPKYYRQLGALDFGYDHPAAAVRLAWHSEVDCVYVTQTYRLRQQTPVLIAAALKPWGEWLPWMWPRDGSRETQEGAGIALANQYRAQGLKMHLEPATFPDGSVAVEAGLMQLLDRMQTGRFKVFRNLPEWFEEYRLYHRKDGKVVKLRDDIMSATRYGEMMLRFAITKPSSAEGFGRDLKYGPSGVF
jgi:hypothetical protein